LLKLMRMRMRLLMLMLMRVLMGMDQLMWHVLHRLLMILGMLRVYHGLNAWYPLLLRGVCTCVLREMSFGHTSRQHVRWARLFFEVRNAYTAVFDVVVGTIDLFLLCRPSGLTQVLETLLQALHKVSM
jgi:hypothetical protein